MTAGALDIFERPIAEIQAEMVAGRVSSEELVQIYLRRIETLDVSGESRFGLNSILAVNREASAQAKALDAERRLKGSRGPLHGIPIVIKDNIETEDALPTTAGSLALAKNRSGRDAPCIARLRNAGVIILGKANLSEWANFRSNHSISGWSAVGGLTRNPHALDRSACGSSSGSGAAVAAGLAAAAIGTETDGSIICPADVCGIVGLKPTVGLVPRTHIIPISVSQDTAGPMTRTVADAALLIAAMAGRDRTDPATAAADKHTLDLAKPLDAGALRGARLGVWRPRRASAESVALFEKALEVLAASGATLIELAGFRSPRKLGPLEFTIMLTEFKEGLNAYLAAMPPDVPVRSLSELIAFNRGEPRELALFGQEIFEMAEQTKGSADADYRKARRAARRLTRMTLDKAISAHALDAIVTITGAPAWRIDVVRGDNSGGDSTMLPAVAGYPHLTVPMGTIRQLPLGLSFIGPAWSEQRLLNLGHAFEQSTNARVAPSFPRSLEDEDVIALALERKPPATV